MSEYDDLVEIDFEGGEFESDEDDIEWNKKDEKVNADPTEQEVDPGLQVIDEAEARTSTAEQLYATSIQGHLQFLKCSAHDGKGQQIKYLKTLRRIPDQFRAYQKRGVQDAPLSCLKKSVVCGTAKRDRSRYLKLEAPVQETLLRIFGFMPDSDSRNQVVAWLLHPGNSKQLHHLLKTTFSSRKLWRHVIINARRSMAGQLKMPYGSTQDAIALPAVNCTTDTNMTPDDSSEHKCNAYHHKKLCRYKITGLQSAVTEILNKYDIPVEIPKLGARAPAELPDIVTQSNDPV